MVARSREMAAAMAASCGWNWSAATELSMATTKARPRKKTVIKKSRIACRFITTSQRHIDVADNLFEGGLCFVCTAQACRKTRVDNNAMREYRHHQSLYVVGYDKVAPFDVGKS